MKISVIIPTYQAERYLPALLRKLKDQTLRDFEIIVVDSSSTDRTVEIARSFGVQVIMVAKETFDHGGTRSFAGRESKGDILVYMTQDALPFNDNSIEEIVKPFMEDSKIGAVYGRQAPYPDATIFAAHSRLFIYKDQSFVRTLADKNQYKIKTAFLSNAFSAYSRKAMEDIGYFKDNLISTEDTYAGAKMLMAGYKLAYAAKAAVYHSHNYTVWQEFKRYFDIGSFHKNEDWIIREFGKANDEGIAFAKSELKYLISHKKYFKIPEFFIRTMLKYIGYRMGNHFYLLPKKLVLKWSMHKGWWIKNEKMAEKSR